MAIPKDTYFIVTPESEFLSKAYANLNGTDLFFYVNETNTLRVVNMNSTATTATPGSIVYTLAQNAIWVGCIARPGVVYVYYANTNGQMFYFPYAMLGSQFTTSSISIAQVVSFTCCYTTQSNPPAYMIMTDDGIHHNLFAARDPGFQSSISSTVVYNNSFDPQHYVIRPSIAMHPLDTTNLTVNANYITVLGDVNQVGFYVVKVPGLE